jgi:OPT family oligopeptide transporter
MHQQPSSQMVSLIRPNTRPTPPWLCRLHWPWPTVSVSEPLLPSSSTHSVCFILLLFVESAIDESFVVWFRRDIARRFRSTLKDERDIHSRLMQAYPEVPVWWYAAVGFVSLLLILVSVSIFDTQLPAWAALIAFTLAAILAIPAAMLQAITNQAVGLQIMHELIIGYMHPGHPVGNMLFKCIAYIGTSQALSFAHSLKLGHYMKIPPRIMFSVQLTAAFVSCFVVLIVQNWVLDNVEDVCTPNQKDGFICASSNTFATASLIWGGVGPARLFSPGAP